MKASLKLQILGVIFIFGAILLPFDVSTKAAVILVGVGFIAIGKLGEENK